MNHGIFMTPGVDEQWTLSVAHSDEELQRYVDAYEAFARDVTGLRLAPCGASTMLGWVLSVRSWPRSSLAVVAPAAALVAGHRPRAAAATLWPTAPERR